MPNDTLTEYAADKVKLENYLDQIIQKTPFDELSPTFTEWLNQSDNWYYIPNIVDICIPDEMPLPEVAPQQAVREMIFDMIARRLFVEKYPEIHPMLFVHWKNEILQKLSISEPEDSEIIRIITAATALKDTEPYQQYVVKIINDLALTLDKYMENYWLKSINKEFDRYIKPDRDQLTTSLNSNTDIAELMQSTHLPKAIKKGNNASVAKLNTKILQIQQTIIQITDDLDRLPKTPSELSHDRYLEFRRQFFENRDVSQCIEPVFARVLGHDRFFSVFVSKTSKKTNITELNDGKETPLQLGSQSPLNVINPCDKRCQFHPLAHLFTGDMLLPQSADKLDQIRMTHSVQNVPDRMMTFKSVRERYQSQPEAQNEVLLKIDHTNEKYQESPIVSPKMPSLLMRSPSFWKQTSAPQQHNAEIFNEKTSEERVTEDLNEVFLEDGHANEKHQESPIVSPKIPLLLMRSPSFCSPTSAPQKPETKIVDENKAEERVTEDLVEADFFNQFEDDFDDFKI